MRWPWVRARRLDFAQRQEQELLRRLSEQDRELGRLRERDSYLTERLVEEKSATARVRTQLAELRFTAGQAEGLRAQLATAQTDNDRLRGRVAELEGRIDRLVEETLALRREGFATPPVAPSPEALAHFELPPAVLKAFTRWPDEPIVQRGLARFAVSALRGGMTVADLVTKIERGENLDDMLD